MKRRRRVLVSVSALIVLVVVALLSQPILNGRIKGRIEVAAQRALHVTPNVRLDGGVAALELFDRKITKFVVSTDSYSTTKIAKIGLVATFSNVSLPHGSVCAIAGRVDVSASIGTSEVARQIESKFRGQSGLTVARVTMDPSGINVAAGPGGVATIVFKPTTRGQELILTVKTILLFGQPLSPSRVASLTGNIHPVVSVNQVPSYLHLTSVNTSATALTLNFEGRNAVLHHGSGCLS